MSDLADCVIVGAGVLGTCAAIFLAEAGMTVRVVDDGRIGGSNANAGSLHVQMQSRFMRMYPDQVPGLEASLHLYPKAVAFWRDLEARLGADFDLRMTGGLMIAESAEQLEFLRYKAGREAALGLRVDILDRTALERLAPYLGPGVVGAEQCHDEGKLNPLLANAALRRHALGLGVAFTDGVHVEHVARDGNGYVLNGTIRARRLLLAAAAGTRGLAAQLGLHIPAEAEPLHMNITEPAAPLVDHLVQHADRPITLKQFGTGQIVIGGGWPARIGGRQAHPLTQYESMVGNATLAQHIVPRIGPLRIIRTWAGLNTTVDGRGVLGAVAGMPGLFVAIPGDAGYTLGPLSARLVADAVIGLPEREDMAPFAPTRFRDAAPS